MMPHSARTPVRATLVALLAATAIFAGAVCAAPAMSPKAAIGARQASFKTMGAAMRTLTRQLRDGEPSRPEIAKAAQAIASASREQLHLFPAGSGASAGIPTSALPAVWTQRKAFDAQMARLVQETGKLAATSKGGDLAAIQAQVKATGAVCSACHRQFRSDS